MFIKVRTRKKENRPVTDTVIEDKKVNKYRSILRIVETIHILFAPHKNEETV